MRKCWKLLLVLIILPIILSLSFQQETNASTREDRKSYKTGSWFEDGKLIYVTKNRKADPGAIRYGTKAFIIHEEPTCDSENPHTAHCVPMAGGSDSYLRIDLYNNSGQTTGAWNWRDIDECEYVRQYGEPGGACSSEFLVFRAEIEKDKFTEILSGHEKFKYWEDGITVYISPVFRVIGDSRYPEFRTEFVQLRSSGNEIGIYNAVRWSDTTWSLLRHYYDVPVVFYGSYPLKVQYLLESDRNVKLQPDKDVISTYGPPNDNDYETGMWPSGNYSKSKTVDGQGIQLDEYITYNGQVYLLQCSYFTMMSTPEEKGCNDEEATDKPYWLRGPDTPERNPYVYVGGTYVVALYNKVDCKCMARTTIPSKTEVEGDVPAEQSTIGKMVPVQVDLTQTPDEYAKWEEWVKDKKNFQIQVAFWRSDQTDVMPDLANTGAEPIVTAGPGSPEPRINHAADKWVNVSADQLLQLLNSKLIYNDDLTNYPIPEGKKVSFRYNTSTWIRAQDHNNNWVVIQCAAGEDSTEMTWYRPEKEPPLVGKFFSVPKYWSEIKQGSPQTNGTGSNEEFDAMSGTPTTRHLYFASGGSEFIVDIEVEYVPQVTESRTYTSEFRSVVNGWAMSPISGSWNNDTQPSRPTPRIMMDQCGASYTETVRLESEPYIKGYTPGEDPQPIYGTRYRWVQEGYDNYHVGGYVDTWTQTVTFDYMKINKAVVWKLDRSKVDGMGVLVGTDEVTAVVEQGDPNIFYNIARENTSREGRLRYSLETNQHDSVYWLEGNSDNCISNSKGGYVNEQQKFDERRNLTTTVTAVSDFLILQTSTGDQSVMYFEKTSDAAKTTEQLDVPTTDFDTMWTNNSLSAANWDQRETIRIGSYNGNYGSPERKYSGTAGPEVRTIFDSQPAGLNRPSRPGPYMRLMVTNLDVPDTLRNGAYVTGTSTVFYRTILNHNPDNTTTAYSTARNAKYGDNGHIFVSTYSPLHSKVNDVVIHNPVSVEDAFVITLPEHLDQRTSASKAIGGNLQEGVAEYERVLDPDYRQNIIANPHAEIVNVDGTVAGWNTWIATGNEEDMIFTSRKGDQWVIGGTSSFEVSSVANSGTTGGYWKDIPVKPDTEYRFDGELSCHRCNGYFSLNFYSESMTPVGSAIGASDIVSGSAVQHKSFTFTSPSNAAYLRVHLIKGDNTDSSNARDHLFADHLSLKNMSVQEFIAVEPVYVTQEIANPDYRPAMPAQNVTFHYTGSKQTYTAPATGTYTLEVWGAEGGTSGYGGKGGYAKGNVDLQAGETIEIYVGGQTGWNGGGSGHGRAADSGGGATDIRRGGSDLHSRIIVAGGGGGYGGGSTRGGDGGGETGVTGGKNYGSPGTGGTQRSGGLGGTINGKNGSFGIGGDNKEGEESGGGGGGGGWYGGGAGGNDYPNHNDLDDSGGGGGSGYIGGVTEGSMKSGERYGNGMARITSPPLPAQGEPTRIVTSLAGGSDTNPPSDAYKLVPVRQNPLTPAGGYTPGNFILLDYAFQLYFPNTGDFYGNGQWGWSQTTSTRGKGFVDNMNTTEWTKAKYVKFDFHVIYNDVLYRSGEWIQLPLNSPSRDYRYDFYVPLANRERVSALVEVKSIAINAPYEDNETPTNRVRYANHGAKHSTIKKFNVDVVGRIGNMTIEDTGDFRFSNLFKAAVNDPTQWIVPNVVRRVNLNIQNKVIGDTIDIRGNTVSEETKYLNTYGLLNHLSREAPIPFPLSAEKNNIPALQRQPLRLGYEVLSDIQTIGNYYSNLQIIPHYYYINLQTGVISPVDVYMVVNGEYKPINKHGVVQPGWDSSSVYANSITLNWNTQAGRRNATVAEQEQTARVANVLANSGGDSATGKAAEPYDNYMYGTSQFMNLTGRNRTYIGQDSTYGFNKNPGYRLSDLEYAMQAQRWHYSYNLPSSAVAVLKGQAPTQENINALRTNTGVIILAAHILAVGDTYTLEYKPQGANGMLNLAGTSWSLASIPYPVIAVYSANRSSADDMGVSGTH